MSRPEDHDFVTLAQMHSRRPVDEEAVARERDAILAESRANSRAGECVEVEHEEEHPSS